MADQAAFQWKCQPKAEALLLDYLEQACKANGALAKLRDDLLKKTSTRLFDWLDHFVIGNAPQRAQEVEALGFEVNQAGAEYRVFHHPGAQLPSIIIQDTPGDVCGVAVKVESISDYLLVRGQQALIEGSLLSSYRRCVISEDGDVTFWVVERRGTRSMEPTWFEDGYVGRYLEAKEEWKSRPRSAENEDMAADNMLELAQAISTDLGRDIAAWIVLEVEREMWQSRNRAAQVQKNRQDMLGMGWANHDHHTFRSSRRHFPALVRVFEILGFHCRERYYAGEEAGWGAQVMENSNAGLVLFLDVDLASEELSIDFAHEQMEDLDKLNTVGLWCALHGDSILGAGMHHLEAQFFFDELTKDLSRYDVGMMEPFSSFPYLRQAFTKGETWQVDHRRVEVLVTEGKLSREQADKFLKDGALGSHLENLQRREGYKGFNQKNVSFIIQKTDPRLASAEAF